MTQEEIIKKLRVMMKQSSQADVKWDTVTEESSIESLGFDSLSILDLIYDIQQELDELWMDDVPEAPLEG